MQLALPSRDYYLKKNGEIELRAYHRYMTQVSLLLGADYNRAIDEFKSVIEFESKLANATLPEADRHDTSVIYRKLTLRELQNQVPQFKWRIYLEKFLGKLKVSEDEPVVAYAMPYFIRMGRIIENTDRRYDIVFFFFFSIQ